MPWLYFMPPFYCNSSKQNLSCQRGESRTAVRLYELQSQLNRKGCLHLEVNISMSTIGIKTKYSLSLPSPVDIVFLMCQFTNLNVLHTNIQRLVTWG